MPTPIETVLKQLGEQIDGVIDGNDAANDVKKVVKAMTQSGLSKLDLVSREEFDAQAAVLQKTRQKLAELEQRLNELNS